MASDVAFNKVTWPNYSVENSKLVQKKDKDGNSALGKDEFLKILIAQLQNQDPMQPMQDRDFIAQMAQFSSVEQLMNIQKQLGTMQQALGMSSSLIGKEITWIASENETMTVKLGDDQNKPKESVKTGIVESIIIREGIPYAKVGKDEVDLTKITEVRTPEAETEQDDGGNEAPPAPEQPEQPQQPEGNA